MGDGLGTYYVEEAIGRCMVQLDKPIWDPPKELSMVGFRVLVPYAEITIAEYGLHIAMVVPHKDLRGDDYEYAKAVIDDVVDWAKRQGYVRHDIKDDLIDRAEKLGQRVPGAGKTIRGGAVTAPLVTTYPIPVEIVRQVGAYERVAPYLCAIELKLEDRVPARFGGRVIIEQPVVIKPSQLRKSKSKSTTSVLEVMLPEVAGRTRVRASGKRVRWAGRLITIGDATVKKDDHPEELMKLFKGYKDRFLYRQKGPKSPRGSSS